MVETRQPSRIRVNTANEDRIEIRAPRIAGDSLVGEANGDSVAVALADVSRVETWHDNTFGGIILGTFVVAVVVAIAAVIACREGCAPGN